MEHTADEAPRLKKLRLALVKLIPRVPNDKASRQHMMTKRLADVVLDYLNWASRYVAPRPRIVMIELGVESDLRWNTRQAEISALLDKVRQGDDLTPYLSLAPHTRGVSTVAQAPDASAADKWSDKDQVLNVMGFHHFHLKPYVKGITPERTDELIFAQVTRDRFHVIALFDHDVFTPGTAERQRLHSVHERVMFAGVAPGSAVIMSHVALSGHSMIAAMYRGRCVSIFRQIDPKLDDASFVAKLYQDGGRIPPKSLKLVWDFQGLDLGLYDKREAVFFVLLKGWN
jgi:hypothetical protein